MSDIETFRADFACTWKWWLSTREETAESYRSAGQAVMQNMNDSDWMAGARAHFAQLADAIRRDEARSQRIRAEMQAERRKSA